MDIKVYIKRGINYIKNSLPTNHIVANIVSLAPSDLLKGKSALITGGTSGIGKAIAIAFLNAGANVIITGRNKERAEEIAKKIQNEVNRGVVLGFELNNLSVDTFPSKIQELLQMIPGKEINILVNSAGIMCGSFKTCTEEEYDKVVDTNLKGVYFLCQAFANYYVTNNIKGNILNIISSSGIRPATSPYMVSKWGERGLTKGLARILAPYGIVVNGIAPGPTATPMQMTSASENIAWPSNLIGRMALPVEIANMAVVLTSNLGNTVIGDIVYMSGGGGVITNEDVKYEY